MFDLLLLSTLSDEEARAGASELSDTFIKSRNKKNNLSVYSNSRAPSAEIKGFSASNYLTDRGKIILLLYLVGRSLNLSLLGVYRGQQAAAGVEEPLETL